MIPTPRYAEIVLRVVPAPLDVSREVRLRPSSKATLDAQRSYDVLIYANPHTPGVLRAESPIAPPPGQPDEIAGMPLVGVEQIVIDWNLYEGYLAAFVEGEKGPPQMRNRLSETLSEGLAALFRKLPVAGVPVRTWWDCTPPELADLPWELVAYAAGGAQTSQFSFVRGQPPASPPPLVPMDGPLRLALIHDPARPPFLFLNSLGSPPGIKIIPMTGQPREALQDAVRRGYELVHIIADGLVSMAYDGILYLFDSSAPELSAVELSALVRSSRVTMIGLSSPGNIDPDLIDMGGRQVPSVYRAFVYLAGAMLPLPNIVAPLGPIDLNRVYSFWRGFYPALANTLAIEQAMVAGMAASGPLLPIAIFLRHSQGLLFRQSPATRGGAQEEPTRINAEYQVSGDLVERLDALAAQYGELPEGVARFREEERAHHRRLQDELNSWVQLAEGE